MHLSDLDKCNLGGLWTMFKHSMEHVQTFGWSMDHGVKALEKAFWMDHFRHTHTHTHSPLLGTKEIRFMKHFDFLQLGKSILGGPFPTQSLPLFCRKEIFFLGGWFPRAGLEQ